MLLLWGRVCGWVVKASHVIMAYNTLCELLVAFNLSGDLAFIYLLRGA